MSNHSSEVDKEMRSKLAEFFNKESENKPSLDDLQNAFRRAELGATGNFPEVKMKEK